MDDIGIAETNDSRVKLLWERDGKTVWLSLDVEPEPEQKTVTAMPPGCEG